MVLRLSFSAPRGTAQSSIFCNSIHKFQHTKELFGDMLVMQRVTSAKSFGDKNLEALHSTYSISCYMFTGISLRRGGSYWIITS